MVSEANILYLLLWHLNRFGWFEIPGTGRFNAIKKSAYLDHLQNKIFPGSILLQFENTEPENLEHMVQNMCHETGYEISVIEDQLTVLSKTITDSLSNYQHFELVPFGSLHKENNNLLFKQSELNLHQDFYGKEALPIVPVSKPFVAANLPPQPFKEEKPKPKKEFRLLLLALAFLWFIFLYLVFCPRQVKSPVDGNHNTAVKDSIQSTELQPGTEHEVDSFQIDQITDRHSDSLEVLNNEVTIDSNNVDQLNDSIKNKTCIIIVGSFIKISNAERLSKKIIEQGYQLYRGSYKNFNRVGVKFNCFKKDLNATLLELKKIYHPDSWILKY